MTGSIESNPSQLGGVLLLFRRLRQQIDQFIGGLDFRRIRLILTVSAGMLILLIGFVATRLDSHEYIHHRPIVDREGSTFCWHSRRMCAVIWVAWMSCCAK